MPRLVLLVCLLLLVPFSLRSQPQTDGPSQPFAKVDLADLESFHRELTLQVIGQCQDPDFRGLLASRLLPGVKSLSLNRLAEDAATLWPTAAHRAFVEHLTALDQDLGQRKGIRAFSHGLLGLEVIWPKGPPPALDWEQILFEVSPQGPKANVKQLEAYDLHGQLHPLDPHLQPGNLVLMAGTDRSEVKRAAIAFMNAGLGQARLSSPPSRPTGPAYCAKLTRIRLKDTQEPWWKGAAEVYAFTAGIDPAEDRPNLKLIDLPYLDCADTDYFPNQLVLFWDQYRYNAADFQLWEQDDGTDYQAILSAVLSGVATAMTVAGAPTLAWIPALADAIISAMPAAWYKDNDDYLDTFYTLEKGRTYVQLPGAGNNASIDLEPFTLLP